MTPSITRLCLAVLAVWSAGAALAAADGNSQITVNGTVIQVPAGSTITVTQTGNGTSIITATATGGSVTVVPTPPAAQAAKPDGVTVTRTTQAVPRSHWDLDMLSGVRFGGIIGASLDNTLSYRLPGPVEPELSADVGVSGATFGLGARWSLNDRQWTLSNQGLSLDYDSNTAILARAIAPYRWEGRKRAPSIWHGMTADSGWYYGGEVDVLVDNFALAVQATWEEERHQHAPRFTLAYGFGF
jgi:hypothetical protein